MPLYSRLLPFFLLLSLAGLSAYAQHASEQEAKQLFFDNRYAEASVAFRKALAEQPTSSLSQLGLAKTLFETYQQQRKQHQPEWRFLNLQTYLQRLYEAHAYATQARQGYQQLSPAARTQLRQALSVTDDEVNGFLLAKLEKEAFELLQSAPYRKPTAQLYAARTYNRVTDADTLTSLREGLLAQCEQFEGLFPLSPHKDKVLQIKRELLQEYVQIYDLRYYGDRSGRLYEKHCQEILKHYSEDELKHILPQFYAAEYGFDYNQRDRSAEYQKLLALAKKHNSSPLELLCRLSIHYGGCQPANRDLYEDFIRQMAPMDIAYIALQRMLAPHLRQGEYEQAAKLVKQFAPLFGAQQGKLLKLHKLLLAQEQPRRLDNLGGTVNGQEKDFQPIITLDGQELYFARKTAFMGEDVYHARKDEQGKWLPAKPLEGSINTKSHEIPLGISARKEALFLYGNYSTLPGYGYVNAGGNKHLGKGDFYYAERDASGNWGQPKAFASPVNSPHYESSMSMTYDGKAILFSSDRPGGVGGYNPNYPEEKLYFHGSGEFNQDLWICERKANGKWGEPINLGKVINTPFSEYNPYLHPDMETLYFCSDGHYGLGGYDVFMSKRLRKDSWTEWSEPVNLGKSVNSHFDDALYLTPLGESALVVSKEVGSTFGREDIYSIPLPKEVQPKPVYYVHGRLLDDQQRPIQADIVVVEEQAPSKPVRQRTTPNGEFLLALPGEKAYFYYPEHPERFSHGVNIDLKTEGKGAAILPPEQLTLTSVDERDEKRQPFVLKTLQFDTNSDVIRPESFKDLDRLAALTKARSLQMAIEGHTDAIASDSFNLGLSQRRAESVKRYLVGKGCNPAHLFTSGYGKRKPIATNETSEGRQLNRRVTFSILNPESE